MYTNRVASAPVAAAVPSLPLVGPNGDSGESIQKLFVANTVEELVAYKQSLNAQAAAVDGDVRQAIGQRYRDLLATCEEVVGMEAVCNHVDSAKQKRQRQVSHLRAGAGVTGSSSASGRFALALRNTPKAALYQHTSLAGGVVNNTNIIKIHGGEDVAKGQGLTRRIHTVPLPSIGCDVPQIEISLSLAFQALASRLNNLNALLDRCGAPTHLLAFSNRLDSKISALQEVKGPVGRTPTSAMGSPVASARFHTSAAGANSSSPASATPLRFSENNLSSVVSQISTEPIPYATQAENDASMLFHRVASEHYELVCHANTLAGILRKISGGDSAVPVTGRLASSAEEGDPSSRERAFALRMGAALQSQVLSILTPKHASPSTPHGAQATGRLRDIDTRCQIEELVIKAIGEAYRHISRAEGFSFERSHPPTNAAITLSTSSSALPATAIGPATTNVLLLFFNDLHQALMVEELIADNYAPQRGASIEGSKESNAAHTPVLRALLRLVDLHELAMLREVESVTIRTESLSNSTQPQRKQTAAVLSSAKLSIRGTNALVAYLSLVLATIVAKKASRGGSGANPDIAVDFSILTRKGERNSTSVNLMELVARRNQKKDASLRSVPNSSQQNPSGSKLQRAMPSSVQAIISDDNDRNAFLDSMLVHVCGSIDAAPLYSTTTSARSASIDRIVSHHPSVAARIDTLTAHLLTPSAASRQSHSPTQALMTSLTCADAKDGCDVFLEWFVSSTSSESIGFMTPHRHAGALAGGGAESVKGSGLSGAWALSPSPQRGFAENVDRATSASMQRVGGQHTFQTWSSSLAEAFTNMQRTTSDTEEASSNVSQIIIGRVNALQSFLARVMFGSDDGTQPSTTSLLATLLNKFSDVEKGTKAGSSSEVFRQRSSLQNPSDTISSARALHSLEALLLSVGASTCTPLVECWDSVAWRTAVENKLSSYVVSAVKAVIRGIADTVNSDHNRENKLFISEEASSVASSQSSHSRGANAARDPARREHRALHAHSKVGLLQASATPLQSASRYDVNAASALANRQLASIETNILGKIARFSKLGSSPSSKKSQVDDESKEESAGKEVPASSSSSFAHRVGVLADLLEALTSIVCRDQLSNRSGSMESLAQLSQTVRVSISEDLLGVLENTVSRHEEHERSNSSNNASTIPLITPLVGALLACLRALEEKVSVAASSSRLSSGTNRSVVVPAIGSNLTSPVSGASSGIFSNELLCPTTTYNRHSCGSDTVPPLLDAVRFVTLIIRPRLESLYVRCFSAKWIPMLGEGLRARLRDGWHSELLSKSSVPMRHDYERLGRLLKSATKTMMRVEKRLKKASGAHVKKAEPNDSTVTSAGAGNGLVENNKYVMPFRTRKMLCLLQSYTNGLSGFVPSSVSEALTQSSAASHIAATSLPPVFTAPTSVSEFNKIAAERFRGSIQPLLWRTESIASSPEVSSFGSSVSYPYRPLPNVTDAIWWAQRTLEADIALLFKAATYAQSPSRNSMRKSDPQELYIAATEQSALVTMTSSVLTPFVLSTLQRAVRETIEELLSEASASKKRSAGAESALSTLTAELVRMKDEAFSKRHVATSETAPKSVAAMAMAPSATAEIVATNTGVDVTIKPSGGGAANGWGDDDEDFELGYSDDDDEKKSEGIATAASADKQIEAGTGGPPQVARQQQAQNGESDSEISLDSDTDDLDGADDIDESNIYEDFASAIDFTPMSLSNANYRTPVVGASTSKKAFFGLCEEFYLQLAFDLKTLQQALAPISEGEGMPCPWSEQCSKLLTDKISTEVDFVNWSLTLPLISKHADAFFSDGRLLWRVLGLKPASFSGFSVSSPFAGAASPLASDVASVTSLTPIPSPFPASSTATPPAIAGSGLSGYSGSGGSLLPLPNQEVERLPLLPVALPQAAFAPLPPALMGPQVLSGAGAASGQRAGLGRTEPSTPAGVRDDAASRLVHGATASLKSFLGGW